MKQRLFSQFPNMREHTKEKDIHMAFEEDLDQACELDSDSDAVQLDRAAHIVRRQMFGEASPSHGFLEDVTKKLGYRCLVSMIVDDRHLPCCNYRGRPHSQHTSG